MGNSLSNWVANEEIELISQCYKRSEGSEKNQSCLVPNFFNI